jgi:hypothetical protein
MKHVQSFLTDKVRNGCPIMHDQPGKAEGTMQQLFPTPTQQPSFSAAIALALLLLVLVLVLLFGKGKTHNKHSLRY